MLSTVIRTGNRFLPVTAGVELILADPKIDLLLFYYFPDSRFCLVM